MRTSYRRRSLVPLVVVLLVGCGSAQPSTTAVPSPSRPASQAPTLPASIAPASPSASPIVLRQGQVAVTVSDRLRVRSEPRVSDDSIKYEPVLPIGTDLFVLDGPVSASGYTWYQVSPVSFSELDGPGFGWVAIADKDGAPWVGPASGPAAGLSLAMAEVPRATADPADASRAADAIGAFGLDLYQRLLTDKRLKLGDRNVVYSPTSTAIALAMARAGAKGDTAAQMDQVLRAKGWDQLGSGLNALDQALASRDATWAGEEGTRNELTLRLANAPFAQRDWSIEPSYLDAIASDFGGGLRLVDYAGDTEAARQTINGWVSDRTRHRIPELLAAGDLTRDTRLTLVNAIYLKAQWETAFEPDLTKPAPFRRLDGSRVDVPTMQRFGFRDIPYATGKGWQATELRYLSPEGAPQLAMLLVMPEDLPAFEATLTDAKLDRITAAVMAEWKRLPESIDCPGVPHDQQDAGCYPYDVEFSMPQFGVETRVEMNDVLMAAGMPLAFDAGADFSGISTTDALHIGKVVHQANIDVDERGTEAAAATAVIGDTGGGPSAVKTIKLHLDHPFLFFVRDVDTGTILFMGRVVDPSVAKGG